MILEGNERGFGAELARHLLNTRDNDHVTVHAVEGFIADDLAGAFAESEAIAQGTQCRKYLFSVSLNPPPGAKVTVEEFEDAIGRIEAKLGLAGQPRAIIFHEKHGRRHAHCVWSRIDPAHMRAINMAHSKRKLMDISITLYRDHGWSMPEGFLDHARRDPLNYSRAEAGQAKRAAHDPAAIKALFKKCWEQSDSRAGFAAALWTEGYCLAHGDQRGFVAVDADGKIWSLSRWCGVKPKDLRARLGEPNDLPSVEDAVKLFEGLPLADPKTKVIPTSREFAESLQRLVESQRQERDALIAAQERRLVAETLARKARMPRGLRAAWARLNGSYERLLGELAREAAACATRDRAERQELIDRHLADRRLLESRKNALDLSKALDEIFLEAVRPDRRQRLLLPNDAAPFTRAQLAEKPDLILMHLSHKKASFRDLDIKRALTEFIDDPLLLRSAIDTALVSPELVRLENGDFTTRDYRDTGQKLETDAKAMAASGGFAVGAHHIEQSMQEQDKRLQDRFGALLSDEQRTALRQILGDDKFSCVVGLAGSGKSVMLETAHNAWTRQGIRVHGAALSGKAAEGLRNASGIESRTLASLETSWKNGYEPIAKGDVLVIDEAGMVGTRQMMRITTKLRKVGAKLVLIGDPGQLQPIEAGAPFRDLIESHGAARLEQIHRQKEAWQRHASRDLAEGRIQEALKAYDADACVHRSAGQEAALTALLEDYIKDREMGGPSSTQLAFAHRRKDVFALNQAIRRALRLSADMERDTIFATETGPRAFAPGDRIVFTRNDKELDVKNGMLGTVETADANHIAVRLDGDTTRRVTIDPDRYRHFDHGYAVTIHKSQGATVDHSYVLASRSMDEPLTYVAMTRHRDTLRLYLNQEDQPDWSTLANTEPRPRIIRARRFEQS
ncbi:AAA family ATPase [Agrobacterium vitis]|uniref:Conjugal transfer protein TraA n=1 Tax=Agrobacterium vitis TaxID=373 RepID=A0A368NQV8_AGRVI|nr:AAA family ATPase [Agrobacterium vitis]KAA3516984.1 conjugal transfer protein TraA [Agrobacterium vitis]KAA3529749.1 conjugal transfer protein TraA [Agrobacterium vitis]MUZ97371.1 AAA family ATPase [Agrobacterium vitis]NOJ36251.1 AAA family ATPase [Agrobacterium vitis]RCU52303.1 conjugal transfer protein TraA [Agrobacterium vitis]